MTIFEDGSCRQALDDSIRAANLAPELAATVATARVLADRIDTISRTNFIDESGKLDNVSIPTYLKYLSALGLTIEPKSKQATLSLKQTDELTSFMSDHGFD